MRLSLLLVAGIFWAGAAGVFAAEEDGGAARGGFFDETRGTTLFAFDEVSLPFSQNLKLVMRSPERHHAKVSHNPEFDDEKTIRLGINLFLPLVNIQDSR